MEFGTLAVLCTQPSYVTGKLSLLYAMMSEWDCQSQCARPCKASGRWVSGAGCSRHPPPRTQTHALQEQWLLDRLLEQCCEGQTSSASTFRMDKSLKYSSKGHLWIRIRMLGERSVLIPKGVVKSGRGQVGCIGSHLPLGEGKSAECLGAGRIKARRRDQALL